MWIQAAFRALTCRMHCLNPEENNWCSDCDTGECVDCGEPVFFHEDCGWYHHIYTVPGCFLAVTRCAEVKA